MKNDLIKVSNQDLFLDSREVAVMVDKNHSHLLRDIKTYTEYISTNPKLDSLDFFTSNTYVDSKGEERPNYQITKKGCEFIAHKLTGRKGAVFTATYIDKFHQMENALKEVYHISETAIVNNIMEVLENRLINSIDSRLSKYEENYRPTHANKLSVNSYIKKSLGDLQEDGEVDLVKERVLLMLDAEAWQDVPYDKLLKNMHLIDESIRAVKSFRTKTQLSIFEL